MLTTKVFFIPTATRATQYMKPHNVDRFGGLVKATTMANIQPRAGMQSPGATWLVLAELVATSVLDLCK